MKIAVFALANILSVAAANVPDPPRVVDPPHVVGTPQFSSAPRPVSPALPTAADPKAPSAVSRKVEPPRSHVCYNASETRDKIVQHRLSDPLRALRAGRLQGEALRAKLCRFKQDDFVYEVFVLRRDGHIVRLYMNAQNGLAIAAPNDGDRN